MNVLAMQPQSDKKKYLLRKGTKASLFYAIDYTGPGDFIAVELPTDNNRPVKMKLEEFPIEQDFFPSFFYQVYSDRAWERDLAAILFDVPVDDVIGIIFSVLDIIFTED